jgi:hypothetical protein
MASKCGRGRLVITTACTLGMLTTVSQAYTLEQEEMCAGDAMRLCSSEIPDVERITICMKRQRDLLSNGCKAMFETDRPVAATAPPVSGKRAGKPAKPVDLAPKPKRG